MQLSTIGTVVIGIGLGVSAFGVIVLLTTLFVLLISNINVIEEFKGIVSIVGIGTIMAVGGMIAAILFGWK